MPFTNSELNNKFITAYNKLDRVSNAPQVGNMQDMIEYCKSYIEAANEFIPLADKTDFDRDKLKQIWIRVLASENLIKNAEKLKIEEL
jgi:hypothetical protein